MSIMLSSACLAHAGEHKHRPSGRWMDTELPNLHQRHSVPPSSPHHLLCTGSVRNIWAGHPGQRSAVVKFEGSLEQLQRLKTVVSLKIT